ncbi:hypothetical protein [Synechococcus sp. CS-1328]|uniref:hypothetical protein n=1 Tax=Synechococcus sp. CS-1328 TaxID=2847976 RepID=UPI00223B0C08|nr:hypothetical protein [Synechococcus sp. CS-1328]MCT0224787.1 hypothetical protein [Synechococcus sp. CS-1328]
MPFSTIAPLAGITELGVLTLFFQVGLEVRAALLIARPCFAWPAFRPQELG